MTERAGPADPEEAVGDADLFVISAPSSRRRGRREDAPLATGATDPLDAPALAPDRTLGTPGGRSVLLTVLGEYVLPRGGQAWTSTLVDALGALGVEEKAARQALARTSSRGLLRSERHGRRVRWHLTPDAVRLLSEGSRRIFSFGWAPAPWDGRWLLVFATVPETRRDLRYRLRTRLSWTGLGPLGQGVWVSPRVEREAEAKQVLDELGLSQAVSFVGRFGEVGDAGGLVAQAWDVAELEARYDKFLAEFGALRPDTGEEAFVAETRLVHEWRRFPFLDPDLPRELLPEDWSGGRACQLFHALHEQWKPAADGWWDERAGPA